MIKRQDWEQRTCLLVCGRTGEPVAIGDMVDSRFGPARVVGGSAPHKPGSTGRVYVKHQDAEYSREFFPPVFNLTWRRVGL